MFIQYLFNKGSYALYQLRPHSQVHTKKSKLIAKNTHIENMLYVPTTTGNSSNSYKVTQNFSNRKLVSPNFVAKLINKYWQETIFLSIANPLSEYYINQLKSTGIAIYQNEYKKFLLDFSKALTTGRLEASLSNSKFSNNTKVNPIYLKYIWRKGVNFSFPHNLWTFLSKKQYLSRLNDQNSILVKKIKDNDFPVFTVINGFNQIVMAESSEEMFNNVNILDKLYQWYYNNFLWTKNDKPIYECLFFMNPEDAIEYKDYIQQKYSESSRQNHLNIFTSKLDLYYQLTRTIIPKVHFRLIPDLTELGELMFRYKKYKNIDFYHRQKYGDNYFQGQPIYLIQPVFAFDKKSKKIVSIQYSYKLNQDKHKTSYEAIFMNYKTALVAWQKFRRQAKYYNLSSYPPILVYNLEDFIKTCENNKEIDKRNILFVPSKESYASLKQSCNKSSRIHVLQKFSSSLLYLQVFSKRILWSLTSRQPIRW